VLCMSSMFSLCRPMLLFWMILSMINIIIILCLWWKVGWGWNPKAMAQCHQALNSVHDKVWTVDGEGWWSCNGCCCFAFVFCLF
jgi:hypothetical protein